jgi:hypothetical protein
MLDLISYSFCSIRCFDDKGRNVPKVQERFRNPWGWGLLGSKPMQFFVTGAYTAADSNIDFCTQEAILGMGGVLFRW